MYIKQKYFFLEFMGIGNTWSNYKTFGKAPVLASTMVF